MNQFALFNYFLAAVALFAHYPIGRRLGIKFLFTACLAGVTFSALIVASLANVSAGLIRPYILLSILVGISLLIYDYFRYEEYPIRPKKFSLKIYFILAVFAGVFFIFNNPAKTYFEHSDDGAMKMYYLTSALP